MLLQFYLCFASTRILAGFQREQVCFRLETAGESSQLTGSTDDAVTRCASVFRK
jgi:hypothetical protein